MMFRDYYGRIDWGAVAFAAFMIIIVSVMCAFMYLAITVTNQRNEEHKAFKEKCIDAGGYPVSPFDYVKGHGSGFLCINPSAIIQLKEEPHDK